MTELDVSQMTPEQRLKQIEVLLSTAAKSIVQSNERMTKLEQGFIESSERMDKLERDLTLISDLVWSTARVQAEHREDIERIWRYLMSQTGNGNGKGEQ